MTLVSRSSAPIGVVLAAGAGTRLAPLSSLRPKALCPVGNEALVDLAVRRVSAACSETVVNVHHGRAAMEAHFAGRVRGRVAEDGSVAVAEPDNGVGGRAGEPAVWLSVEDAEALGTAGALGRLRPWLDGRAVLVANADAWCQPDLTAFVAHWDRERVALLLAGGGPFGPGSLVVASLLPWSEVVGLRAEPTGLYECCWRDAAAQGRLDVVAYDGPFVDCGTPAQYLAANLAAAGGCGASLVHPEAVVAPGVRVVRSVVGAGATVDGDLDTCVVWDGSRVAPGESLRGVVRADGGVTVAVPPEALSAAADR
ncbi:MAG: sugar phosphate nucleotidyltransferase [Acidimicrobiales bacterium]|nr:sugar phosphate nucleotidyltransferase [Acidimicrobiales bacterium]